MVGNLKSDLTATSNEIGVYAGVYKSTGTAHSSDSDRIPVDIKAGESFSVRAMFDTSISGYWQCFASYSDGTNKAIFSYLPNQEYTTTASKDIVSIGIAVGTQSEAYTCCVTINSEQSVVKNIAKNTSDIADLQEDLKGAVAELLPIISDVVWERGYINDTDGSEKDSNNYVRTADYISVNSFGYIHMAEKCRIEVFFYNSSGTFISYASYGGSTAVEQDIYLTYPAGAVTIRI